MISLETARKLKSAGLLWQPAHGDQFVVPDRGMDDQIFIMADMAAVVEQLKGVPAITFHGTPEWALDYIHLGETVWLPSEEQLRAALEARLNAGGVTVYDLLVLGGTYSCRFEWNGEQLAFHSVSGPEAYAEALLHLLQNEKPAEA